MISLLIKIYLFIYYFLSYCIKIYIFIIRLEVSIGKIGKQRIIIRIPRRPSNSLQLNFEVISSDRNKRKRNDEKKKRKRQKEK